VKARRIRLSGGAGYDDTLPSEKPFMFVERHERRGDLGVIAFGAYNAFGLIGSEKGGVGVVLEKPEKSVLATKSIPWNPAARDVEVDRVMDTIEEFSLGKASIPMNRRPLFVDWLVENGYRGY